MAGLFKRTARSWIYKNIAPKQGPRTPWSPPKRQRPATGKTKQGRRK